MNTAPERQSLIKVTPDEVEEAIRRLNVRPRKGPGFKTLVEAFRELGGRDYKSATGELHLQVKPILYPTRGILIFAVKEANYTCRLNPFFIRRRRSCIADHTS